MKITKEYRYTQKDFPFAEPLLEIKIIQGGTVIPVSDAILDSGTDSTLMSEELGFALGIDPSKCEKTPIRGILGQPVEGFMANIKIQVDGFEDYPLDIKATFVPGMGPGVLLGRDDFFDNFEILFLNRRKVFKLTSLV